MRMGGGDVELRSFGLQNFDMLGIGARKDRPVNTMYTKGATTPRQTTPPAIWNPVPLRYQRNGRSHGLSIRRMCSLATQ